MPRNSPADVILTLLASKNADMRATRLRRGLRMAACFTMVGLLAACASHAPRLSNAEQAGQYKDNAAGNYAPPGPPSDPWGPYIVQASQRFDVPQSWIRNVMHTESGGQLYVNGGLVTSGVGAMGLMQVMPETYQELQAQYGLGDDPYAPHDNIMAGTAYLREMYDLFGSPGFLAAYNAGPQRLNQYLTDGRPLPAETTHYVAMISPSIQGDMPSGRSPADQFAMNSMNAPSARPYNGGAVAGADSGASLAETGGGAVGGGSLADTGGGLVGGSGGNMMLAMNKPGAQQPTFQPAATESGQSADDLNSQQVAAHSDALVADGGGAVPADLMVATNEPRPTQAQVDQQEAAADSAAPDADSAPAQVAAYQPAVTQAPVFQTPVVQMPMRVAVLTPPAPAPTPAPRPVFQVAPAYQPSYGRTAAPSQSAANPPAARLAAFTPPIRRTYAAPRVVGPYGTQNLASEMNEPAASRSGGGLHLIAPAMADTIPLTLTVGGAGSWAIQVGAYGSASDAREAVQSARQHEHFQLASARTIVMPVHVSQKLLYRARLAGLSEGAAVNACNVISRHSPCMVISPDAQ
ncbi:lytic transglycosylase domain-containing protein [Acidisoma cladoniae]|jgi:hypothetical protein|uniref:lytic transglycosylase domain-containing protein n=1 Tax=Acidisoma cladoniae TaxID=3040935 RepID=UPI0033142EC8